MQFRYLNNKFEDCKAFAGEGKFLSRITFAFFFSNLNLLTPVRTVSCKREKSVSVFFVKFRRKFCLSWSWDCRVIVSLIGNLMSFKFLKPLLGNSPSPERNILLLN